VCAKLRELRHRDEALLRNASPLLDHGAIDEAFRYLHLLGNRCDRIFARRALCLSLCDGGSEIQPDLQRKRAQGSAPFDDDRDLSARLATPARARVALATFRGITSSWSFVSSRAIAAGAAPNTATMSASASRSGAATREDDRAFLGGKGFELRRRAAPVRGRKPSKTKQRARQARSDERRGIAEGPGTTSTRNPAWTHADTRWRRDRTGRRPCVGCQRNAYTARDLANKLRRARSLVWAW